MCASAEAQIRTPVAIGSNFADVTIDATLAITTIQAVPAGGSILVATSGYFHSDPPTSASCSDSAGNVYATDASERDNDILTVLCSTHGLATSLPSGSTIFVTWSGGAGAYTERAEAFLATGLTAAPLDRTLAAVNISGSPTVTLPAPTSQANELLFAVVVHQNEPANDAGFATGDNGTGNPCATSGAPSYSQVGIGVSSDQPPSLFAMQCIVSATGTYQANATVLPDNTIWEMLLATYEAAPPPPAPALGNWAMLLFAGGLALVGLLGMRRRLSR